MPWLERLHEVEVQPLRPAGIEVGQDYRVGCP